MLSTCRTKTNFIIDMNDIYLSIFTDHRCISVVHPRSKYIYILTFYFIRARVKQKQNKFHAIYVNVLMWQSNGRRATIVQTTVGGAEENIRNHCNRMIS